MNLILVCSSNKIQSQGEEKSSRLILSEKKKSKKKSKMFLNLFHMEKKIVSPVENSFPLVLLRPEKKILE